MEQEDKKLLLRYLCMALPYNTIVSMAEGEIDFIECKIKWNKEELTLSLLHQIKEEGAWEFVKPYLRPMSSMTEEEEKEFNEQMYKAKSYSDGKSYNVYEVIGLDINYLNAHHFDYFGLIPKGLAIEVTENNNPYKAMEE